MPDDIRTQVARGLAAASFGRQLRDHEATQETWLRAADYAIRLAAWARVETPKAQLHYRLKGERLPLTLPPEDFQP